MLRVSQPLESFGGPASCLLYSHFLLPLQEDPGAEHGPCPPGPASLGEEAGAGVDADRGLQAQKGEPLNVVLKLWGTPRPSKR